MEKALTEYMDQHGFIGHKDSSSPDGLEFGDGTQRLGTFWIVRALTGRPNVIGAQMLAEQLNLIFVETRIRKTNEVAIQWVRHWDESRWPGQLWVMSRDNFDPLFWACVLFHQHDPLVKLHMNLMIKRQWQRFGFMWNWKHIWPKEGDEPKAPDFVWPWDLWEKTIRARNQWWLWPVLCLLDFDAVVNSIIRVWVSIWDQHSTSSDLNHQLRMACGQVLLWTPTIWLARAIYRLRRASGPRGGQRIDGPGSWTAWLHYFNHENDPPMPQLFWPVWNRWIK